MIIDIPKWATHFIVNNGKDTSTSIYYYRDAVNNTTRPIIELIDAVNHAKAMQAFRGNPNWLEEEPVKEGSDTPPSIYHVKNPGGKWLDFYSIWDAIMLGKVHQVGDTAIAHAAKKMLAPGKRDGKKDRLHDLKDMQWTVGRAIEQEEQRLKTIDEAG